LQNSLEHCCTRMEISEKHESFAHALIKAEGFADGLDFKYSDSGNTLSLMPSRQS